MSGASPLPELDLYGWSPRWAALFAEVAATRPSARPARVVRHDGSALLLVRDDGQHEQRPVLAAVDPTPVVGDWVAVDGDAIVATLPRASLLRRRDPDREEEQAMAANVDDVLIVCGLDRPVKPGRIQRTIAVAWDAGAVATVVLTKADLVDDPEASAEDVRRSCPGTDVIVSSTVDGSGVDAVRELTRGRTIVLLGESGAGKSTLTNALVGTDVAATGAVRAGDAKGRHTTTARLLHLLPSGGVLIDTPGIRSVGLMVDADAVAATFDDVSTLATECRFSDCAHDGEPGCAVEAAVAAGDLEIERVDAWRAFERETTAAARRAVPHEQRRYQRRFGRVVKDAQKRKGRS
jgi:ribosome biogenesis GTPase